MATFEEIFGSSSIEVVVPPASLEFPASGEDVDEWHRLLSKEHPERDTAFFDEQLESVLILRCNHPIPEQPADKAQPPVQLLAFLSHLQIVLEASYISSIPASATLSASTQLSAPPRNASLNRLKSRPPNLHPSIFPPQTPRPTPYTADADRRYVGAEGTPLATLVWGEKVDEDTREAFSLCWSEKGQVWMALYRLVVGVSFLRIPFPEPLLCLTVSATLRDKSTNLSPANRSLYALIKAAGGLPSETKRSSQALIEDVEDRVLRTGLEDVNLLAGLSLGPTFSLTEASHVYLPSSRLGETTRRTDFAIAPPVFAPSLVASPTPTMPKAHQTMRKSFRKTLATASGFRVRMRTVFAPYVLLQAAGAHTSAEELLAAGGSESTVVLSVELENTSESEAGFAVERVVVKVSGEGARASLVSWDTINPDSVFPVKIAPYEQYNLLYAVSFQRSPEADDLLMTSQSTGDLQRAVTIDIFGRPYEFANNVEDDASNDALSFPTRTFSSRWNCVLDLAPNRNRESRQFFPDELSSAPARDALPEPASPFPSGLSPGPTATGGTFAIAQQAARAARAVAGSRKYAATLAPGGPVGTPIFVASPSPMSSAGGNRMASALPTNYRAPASALNPAVARERELDASLSRRPGTALPPSIAAQQHAPRRTPTTYAPPASPPLPSLPIPGSTGSLDFGAGMGGPIMPSGGYGAPQTPAYPAFPMSPGPSTPRAQVPVASQNAGAVGPSVEIRRERGAGGIGSLSSATAGTLIPPTPGPWVTAAPAGELAAGGQDISFASGVVDGPLRPSEEGEGIVVSIGLLNRLDEVAESTALKRSDDAKIYPLDRFTLDIFVFNQSTWTRRLEISYPDRRRRRRDRAKAEGVSGYFGSNHPEMLPQKKDEASPGIVPLENRIRVGPLLPTTCQSVRMDFLAMKPGVHPVEALILTDIESGYAVNLRSIMDVVIHEPW